MSDSHWHIYTAPFGNVDETQIIETTDDGGAARKVADYVRDRLPKEDIVTTHWGTALPGAKPFDASRLREATNPDDGAWQEPIKPIVMLAHELAVPYDAQDFNLNRPQPALFHSLSYVFDLRGALEARGWNVTVEHVRDLYGKACYAVSWEKGEENAQ